MSDVRIHHPGRDRTLTVPASLYPGRLAGKGWELVETIEPAPGPDEVTAEDELNAELDRRAGIESPDEEKARLTAQLEADGVVVDRRWGLKRLRTEAANLEDPA